MDGKKISFGFAKVNKKQPLQAGPAASVPLKSKDDSIQMIECLEGQSIKVIGPTEDPLAPLVIPLREQDKTTVPDRLAKLLGIKQEKQDRLLPAGETTEMPSGSNTHSSAISDIVVKEEPRLQDDVDLLVETIEQRAAREILEDLNQANIKKEEQNNFIVPLLPEELPLDGAQQSTMDDYAAVPIEQFGLAMLRGMGYKDAPKTDAAKTDGPDFGPVMRPKGLGLGADRAMKAKAANAPLIPPAAGEVLTMQRGAQVKVLAGKHKDAYGMPPTIKQEAALRLIRAVRNRRCLWLERGKSFKNNVLKNDTWEAVSAEMGEPVEAIKKKWRNLTIQYYNNRKMLRANRAAGADATHVKPPSWWGYSHMRFLEQITQPRKTVGQMFTVAEYCENGQRRVLAVPDSWVRDGKLMWPNVGNKAANKLRISGTPYHGDTTAIRTTTHRKYDTLLAAESAAAKLLKLSDIEARRRPLRPPKGTTVTSSDDDNGMEPIAGTSSNKRNISEMDPLGPSNPGRSFKRQSTEPRCEAAFDQNPMPFETDIFRNGMLQLQQTVDNLSANVMDAVKTQFNEQAARLELSLENMKKDIINAVKMSFKESLEAYFERNNPQEEAAPQQQQKRYAVNHKAIKNEQEVADFDRLLASEEVFTDYINHFKKIIIPNTYETKGDTACYAVVDWLFSRVFWTSLTWTGINRGAKSNRGFREYRNVVQLLLTIVRAGDSTYTSIKLGHFCKKKLFRCSKARARGFEDLGAESKKSNQRNDSGDILHIELDKTDGAGQGDFLPENSSTDDNSSAL